MQASANVWLSRNGFSFFVFFGCLSFFAFIMAYLFVSSQRNL